MSDDSFFPLDRTREFKALEKAKEINANRTVAVKLRDCIVYVKPEQAADEKYMAGLQEKYDKARMKWYAVSR